MARKSFTAKLNGRMAAPRLSALATTNAVLKREIAARKRIEAELRELTEDMATAQALAHFGSWKIEVTPDQELVDPQWWSDECYRILGVEPSSIPITKKLFYEHIHPADRAHAAQALAQAIQTGVTTAYQYRVLRHDGIIRYLADRVKPVFDRRTGRITKVVGMVCDITEQVQATDALDASQRLMQATLNSLSAQICVLDEAGKIIAVNDLWKSFGQANGASLEKVCEGVDYLQVCEATQGEDRAVALALADGIRAVAQNRSDYFEFEYACHSSEEQRWFLARVTPLIGSATNRRRIVVAHENITAFKQLELENERLTVQFYQAQKMESLGRLAGGIAHDFNNLLMPIMGYAELAMHRIAPGQQLHEYFKRIKEAGERAASLTHQILVFSRQQMLEMKTLDLNQVLRDFAPMLRRLIGEDITLELVLASALPQLVADKGQLEQVVLNLVVNARDAMSDGGRLLIETTQVELDERIRAHQFDLLPGSYLLLTVSDTGCGMDSVTQESIFDPFFTTKPLGRGTGLGLATVFGIIKQHKGHIVVYSEVGYGTTFKIYLPLAQPSLIPAESRIDQAGAWGGTETILLVEDEGSVRQLIGDILQTHGYQLLVADDPTQGLALAAAHPGAIDLLLTDVVMPQMSGPKLYQQLAAQDAGLKVLYMSGYTDNLLTAREGLETAAMFLQKPFAIGTLLQKVRAALTPTAT